MNTILTLVCFALVAHAAAQPGYSYQQPKQIPILGSVNIQPQQNYIASLPAAAPQFVPHNHGIAAPQNQYVPPSAPAQGQQLINPAPQFVAPAPAQQQQGGYSQHYQQPQQQTIISKDIYIHSAPEETEEIGGDEGAEAGPIRKNYRIVFVKAPAQNIKLNVDALKRAQAAHEEKTLIYVLTKKPDLSNIQSQLANVATLPKANKPEVFFIKYKTQEEANRAQQEIQAQYDALGGATHISDEGIAPVTSVIGSSSPNAGSAPSGFEASASNNAPLFASNSNYGQPSYQGNERAGSSAVGFGVEAPKQKYLPSPKK